VECWGGKFRAKSRTSSPKLKVFPLFLIVFASVRAAMSILNVTRPRIHTHACSFVRAAIRRRVAVVRLLVRLRIYPPASVVVAHLTFRAFIIRPPLHLCIYLPVILIFCISLIPISSPHYHHISLTYIYRDTTLHESKSRARHPSLLHRNDHATLHLSQGGFIHIYPYYILD